MISKQDVKKLAELALIDVSDAELEKVAGELDAVLGYVGEVTKLSSEEVEREKPALYNVMRNDEVTNPGGEYTETILSQAPDRDGRYLRVKKIL